MPFISGQPLPIKFQIVENPNPLNDKSKFIGIIQNHGTDHPPYITGKTPEDLLVKYEKIILGLDYKTD